MGKPGTRPIVDAFDALLSESLEPLVAGFLADSIATADFNDRYTAIEAVENER
jgi:hypothetical protein